MSSWDGTQILRWAPVRRTDYPEWADTDCGCCNGIEWSTGYEARECRDCMGTGVRCVHLPSGTVALFPGGPLLGARLDADALERVRSAASAGASGSATGEQGEAP